MDKSNTGYESTISWIYVKELFVKNGAINHPYDDTIPACEIRHPSFEHLYAVAEFCNIPREINIQPISVGDPDDSVTVEDYFVLRFVNSNCIDFLGRLFQHPSAERGTQESILIDSYTKWLAIDHCNVPSLHVQKVTQDAVLPSKCRQSDAGYDLTVVRVEKVLRKNVTLYDTSLRIDIPHGFYVEIVPRSSLSKSGYMLANSMGIIDQSYRGNLFIALTKIDPDAPDIVLPFRCCQIIFRKQFHMNIVECESLFMETERGAGGFGSTRDIIV